MDNESSKSQRQIAERKKSNLAFAFFCMEKSRAEDMDIFYAFCRLMDDIADDEHDSLDSKKKKLSDWREEIRLAYETDKPLSPLGEEMRALVKRRKIPQQYVQDLIDGVARDTEETPFETFDDIKKYCYGVASAVGLSSIYIFGFKNPRAVEFAETLGYALQFTNILRDVLDDLKSHGRIYIPAAEMRAFGVSRKDLETNPHSAKCRRLYALMYFRAKHFFNKARRLLPPEDKRAFAPALIMWAIYEKILESLRELDFYIPEKPLKISKRKKIALAMRAIRESKRPEPADKKFGRVAVLGAGVAGLATAVKLAGDGFDVSLYDAKTHIGGRAAQLEWGGAKLDNATHAAMGCYKNFFALLDKFGTNTPEYFEKTRSMEFLFENGKSASVKFPDKNTGFFKRAFACLDYCKLDGMGSTFWLMFKMKFGLAKPLAGENAAKYLERQHVGWRGIRNFWEPFCVSALNTHLGSASAKLMVDTAQKSILKGGDNGTLLLPQKPIAEAVAPATTFIESVGGKIFLGESVEKIFFKGNKIEAIATNKCDCAACDFVVSALPAGVLAKLLPDSALKSRISEIAHTDVTNVYFLSDKKLLRSRFACLAGSPVHWLFDHTNKIKGSPRGLHLYGATVSDSTLKMSKNDALTFLKTELKKYFGDFEISNILPSTFAASTISADCDSEASRPDSAECAKEFPNLRICGDWVRTGLPATLESAAKSAEDLKL